LYVDDLKCDELDFAMEINVRNIGEMSGDHVVMLLWNPPIEAVARGAPRKQLVGFERICKLHPGDEQKVVVGLNVCKHLSYANRRASKVVTTGMHTIATENFEHRILVGGVAA
jgi:beta-D-xylosidase 4